MSLLPEDAGAVILRSLGEIYQTTRRHIANTIFSKVTAVTREPQNLQIILTAMELFYRNMNGSGRTRFVRSKYYEKLTAEKDMFEHPVAVILGINLSLIFTSLVHRSQGRHVVKFETVLCRVASYRDWCSSTHNLGQCSRQMQYFALLSSKRNKWIPNQQILALSTSAAQSTRHVHATKSRAKNIVM